MTDHHNLSEVKASDLDDIIAEATEGLAEFEAEKAKEIEAVKNAARFRFEPAIDYSTNLFKPGYVNVTLEIPNFKLACGCVAERLTCCMIVKRPDKDWEWVQVINKTEAILVDMAVEQTHALCGMHDLEARGLIKDVPDSEWSDIIAEDEERWWEAARFWCRRCKTYFSFGPGVEIMPLEAGRSARGICPKCGLETWKDAPE